MVIGNPYSILPYKRRIIIRIIIREIENCRDRYDRFDWLLVVGENSLGVEMLKAKRDNPVSCCGCCGGAWLRPRKFVEYSEIYC